MEFPDDRAKRMFQDGQAIGEIASIEMKHLIKENELYLKGAGINPEKHEVFCNIAMSKTLFFCMSLGVAVKLLPGFLRVVANSIDIIVQNAIRDKKEGK